MVLKEALSEVADVAEVSKPATAERLGAGHVGAAHALMHLFSHAVMSHLVI